jgi:hypothetical protein
VPYAGPHQAVESVLWKLGIDPRQRLHGAAQDAEYTACDATELGAYLELYRAGGLSHDERAVLACFMLESLNDMAAVGVEHSLQQDVLGALLSAGVHQDELAYWSDTSDPDEGHWWPLTSVLLDFQRTRAAS